MAQICLAVTIITLLTISHGVSAKHHNDAKEDFTSKRGCSAFGHSCFGGHGKRSGDTSSSIEELVARNQLGQEETPPHPVYPHSGYTGVLPAGDDIIPVRDGGAYDRDDTVAREVMKMKLRNIFKHLNVYWRPQQNTDDGYYNENL